jgi:hypothetical protein
MIESKSNLIHASGYPFLFGLPWRLILEPTHGEKIANYPIYNQYLIILSQHLFAVFVLAYYHRFIRTLLGSFVANATTLLYGLDPVVAGATNSFSPEWFQGAIFMLLLCISYVAFTRKSYTHKLIYYGIMSALFTWCYLVKYNALLALPIFIIILLLDNISILRKAGVAALSGTIAAAILFSYIAFFHRPSTGTADLNYDHAWVLQQKAGDFVPRGNVDPEAGTASKQLAILYTLLPQDNKSYHAFWNANFIDSSIADPLREKYAYLLHANADAINAIYRRIGPLEDVPLRFSWFSTAIYLSMSEADKLGVRVFAEHVAKYPLQYINNVFQMTLNRLNNWVHFRYYPLSKDLTGKLPLKWGYVNFSFPRDKPPSNFSFWYSKGNVWAPGVWIVSIIDGLYRVPANLVYSILTLIFAVYMVDFIRGKATLRACVFTSSYLFITLYVIASIMIITFRSKEAMLIMPVLYLIISIAIADVAKFVVGFGRRQRES